MGGFASSRKLQRVRRRNIFRGEKVILRKIRRELINSAASGFDRELNNEIFRLPWSIFANVLAVALPLNETSDLSSIPTSLQFNSMKAKEPSAGFIIYVRFTFRLYEAVS